MQSRHPPSADLVASALAVACALMFACAPLEAEECGPVPYPGAAGPYDYVDSRYSWNLNDINVNHWEKAQRFIAEGRINLALGEIKYLLIRVPNHYPALFELGRLQERYPGVIYTPESAGREEGLEFSPTPECYFDRAFRYRPKDATLRMLFGMYYHKINELQKALVQYQKAEAMDPASSEIQYNLGLLYFDLKDYESSLAHAQKAYALGYPLGGLRKKLMAAGQWPASGG